jgi:signal transduction histidine kinase
VSIRFKVIFPYLLLTLIVAVTGAYVVTRLVSNSLSERLSNQLLEAGRVVSDTMARQEVKHLEAARIVAFTRGLGEALQARDGQQVAVLAVPAAGGLNVESLMVFDPEGRELLHLIKQSNGSIMDVSQAGRTTTLPIVQKILVENNPDSLPKREIALDPVDGRYYYFTTIPVASEQGVVGAVVVGTSLDTLTPLLKNTAVADVIIYGQNGQAIASSLGGQVMEPVYQRTISIPSTLYDQVIGQDEIVWGEDFNANNRWYRVGRAPLKVGGDRIGVFAVVLPLNFVVESSSTSRNNYIILYTLAMVAVIGIGYFVARLIINPLYKLVTTSRAIAGGDLTQRTEIQSKDEIGVLATSFDTMTEKLQQRTLDLEKANRILEQMDRTKMRFIQISAHELRTPMTLVQGYAQMLQVKLNGNDEFKRFANGIMDGSNRMMEVIDSMLDVSRIDTKQLEIMPETMQVADVFERVEDAFQTAFKERNIKFTISGITDLPEIRGDKDFLYKVFYHVIGNAIKYTPDGGKVTVTGSSLAEVGTGKPLIEIAIKDTGIGIDPEYQELVFEKFYQTGEVLLHSSGKTKFKGGGPGLGLAIARGIVDAHQGRIWLESPGHNEQTNPGTTVFVRLPVNGPVHEVDLNKVAKA